MFNKWLVYFECSSVNMYYIMIAPNHLVHASASVKLRDTVELPTWYLNLSVCYVVPRTFDFLRFIVFKIASYCMNL